MRMPLFLALALWALAPAALAESRRYRCDEALVDAGDPFHRLTVLLELTKTTFFDNEGRPFRFDAPGPDLRLDLNVRHSVHGFVSQVDGKAWPTPSKFAGLLIEYDGSLDGTDAHIDYGEHQKEGYLTALFCYFRDRLPVGATFKVLDISATRDVGHQAAKLDDAHLALFASTVPGAKLYRMYRKIRAVAGPPETLAPGWNPVTARGFANYLTDVGTIWGRVARHANFRRNYRSKWKDSLFPLFTKLAIPDALRVEEDQLLASLRMPFLLTAILPPLPALPFEADDP